MKSLSTALARHEPLRKNREGLSKRDRKQSTAIRLGIGFCVHASDPGIGLRIELHRRLHRERDRDFFFRNGDERAFGVDVGDICLQKGTCGI